MGSKVEPMLMKVGVINRFWLLVNNRFRIFAPLNKELKIK